MDIRNLGQSGLRVSTIGIGCNNFGGRIDEAAAKAVIHKAFDLGITLFDTADVYGERGGSETVMGRILGDQRTPIEETLRALDDLIRQGKVRYIGCSNFPAWQMTEAAWTARTAGLNGFISCQDEFSLVYRSPEAELLPASRKLGLGLLPYFPLASGLLTGKYRRTVPLPAGTRLAGTQRLA